MFSAPQNNYSCVLKSEQSHNLEVWADELIREM